MVVFQPSDIPVWGWYLGARTFHHLGALKSNSVKPAGRAIFSIRYTSFICVLTIEYAIFHQFSVGWSWGCGNKTNRWTFLENPKVARLKTLLGKTEDPRSEEVSKCPRNSPLSRRTTSSQKKRILQLVMTPLCQLMSLWNWSKVSCFFQRCTYELLV